MARSKKKTHLAVVPAPPEPEKKVKYKKYWIELLDQNYCVRDQMTVPHDAPVRIMEHDLKDKITTISECEPWHEIEMFHNGRWTMIRLQYAPKRYKARVTFEVSTETPEPEENFIADLKARYGSNAKIEILEVQELAEPLEE